MRALIHSIAFALFALPLFAIADTADFTHRFSFDEGGGRSVSDTGGQNGVLYGTSTGFGWAGGKAGTALGMDGAPGTGVALPNGFLSGSAGTISAWVKMSTLTDQNVLFSGKSSTDNNMFVALSVDYQGRPQLLFRTDPNGVNRKVQIGAILGVNEWYHLVLTASGGSYRAYVNGEEKQISGENIGRWFPDFMNHTLAYRIGASEANPQIGSWNGYIDELRLYARALTESEVSALYNEGNAGTPTAPLALRPTLSFSVSHDRITPGGLVELTWTGTKVDTCEAGGAWGGTKPASGSEAVKGLLVNAEFSLRCKGPGGFAEQAVRVFVGPTTQATSGGTLTVTEVTPAVGATSATPATPTVFVRDLGLGARGEDVRALQRELIRMGHLTLIHDAQVTDYYGPLTAEALKRFQVAVMLPGTGYFGPLTRRAMTGGGAPTASVVPVGLSPAHPPVAPSVAPATTVDMLMKKIAELQLELAKLRGAQ